MVLNAVQLTNRGAILSRLGHKEEAFEAYKQALTLNPQNEQAWVNKGAVLQALGRPAEALAACDHALAINPLNERAWANKGVMLNILGRPEEALAAYEKALELNPQVFMRSGPIKGVRCLSWAVLRKR